MNWKQELKKFITEDTVIMGIGSELKTDDKAGLYITKKIKENIKQTVIVAGQTPEHWLGYITQGGFRKLLIVDSVVFDGNAGDVKFFSLEEISREFGMTHNSPLHLFSSFIRKEGAVEQIKILAVKPETIETGERLTPAVKKSADIIIDFFLEKQSL